MDESQTNFRRLSLLPYILQVRLSVEGIMKYRVHQLEVKKDTAQEKLQNFLNQLDGEILAVVPNVSPVFKGMGATARVDFLLIVEKTA